MHAFLTKNENASVSSWVMSIFKTSPATNNVPGKEKEGV